MIHKTPDYQVALDTIGKQSAVEKIKDAMNGSHWPKGLSLPDVAVGLSLVYGVEMEYVVSDLEEAEKEFYDNNALHGQVQRGEV